MRLMIQRMMMGAVCRRGSEKTGQGRCCSHLHVGGSLSSFVMMPSACILAPSLDGLTLRHRLLMNPDSCVFPYTERTKHVP